MAKSVTFIQITRVLKYFPTLKELNLKEKCRKFHPFIFLYTNLMHKAFFFFFFFQFFYNTN